MKEHKITETRTAKIWLEEDGIVRNIVLPGAAETLDDVKENVSIHARLRPMSGKRVPVLVDLRTAKSLDREARNYLASEQSAKVVSAAALLISSPLSKFLGNLFLGLGKPTYPVKLFTSEAEAVAWLKEFLE